MAPLIARSLQHLRNLLLAAARPAALALMFAGTLPATASAQANPPQRLRIVGGLAGLNQYTRHEEPFWTTDLPKLTVGHLHAEIVPFDRAGIRGQEMLQLMQLGVVPFGTALVSQSAVAEPLLAVPDLAGLNPDIASLRRTVAAFRPQLEKTLRERHGIELLAIYTYPAQVLFCKKSFDGLGDLAKYLSYGASPRASIALVEAARALSFMRGRGYVLPEALGDLSADCLRHRLVLSYEALAEGLTADALIAKVMAKLPLPDKPLQHQTT